MVAAPSPEAGAVRHHPVCWFVNVYPTDDGATDHFCSITPVHDHIWTFELFSLALSMQWLEFQMLIALELPDACAGTIARVIAVADSTTVPSAIKRPR